MVWQLVLQFNTCAQLAASVDAWRFYKIKLHALRGDKLHRPGVDYDTSWSCVNYIFFLISDEVDEE